MSTVPRCIPIADARGVGAGGKAEGLALLSALGLPVPDGFVILDPTPESLPDDLELAYNHIGRARVALTLAEASEVQPDEIPIAPVIDVGWTPAFATIGGFRATSALPSRTARSLPASTAFPRWSICATPPGRFSLATSSSSTGIMACCGAFQRAECPRLFGSFRGNVYVSYIDFYIQC